ncbi:MAG: MerR family transcriptional regulator [Deltaproteobacteria bacterium]|nr:MerR family transcriptional regulator [Kofleriaceae bacterium]
MSVTPRFYSSSELLEIAGTTRKTLRVIEAHGLLRPARHVGTHRYGQESLRRLWLVLLLRRLGFSLDEIVVLLGVGDAADGAGEAARALATTVSRVIRRIDGSIRDLELARDALATTRVTLEACGACTQARPACEGCARSGKLDAVAAILLVPVETTDPAAETSVRRDGPAGQPELVHRVQRRRA